MRKEKNVRKLELKLKSQEELSYQMASLFHGALMELLPQEYGDYLHLSQLHPYTQHLEYRGKTGIGLYAP